MKSTIIYLLYVKEYFSLDYQIPPPDPDPSIEGSPISDHSQIVFFATVHTSLFVFFRSSNQSKNKIILQEILLFYSKVTRKIQILLLKILYYYYYLSLILLI